MHLKLHFIGISVENCVEKENKILGLVACLKHYFMPVPRTPVISINTVWPHTHTGDDDDVRVDQMFSTFLFDDEMFINVYVQVFW